jgi:hypothetical protein
MLKTQACWRIHHSDQCFIPEYRRQRRRGDRHLYLDSDSRAALTEETAELYANTITVDNGAELALGLGQVDTHTWC